MWNPNRLQWTVIWLMAVLLILAWPPGVGKSLGAKVVNWIVDPTGVLPELPANLPMSLDDDGDAVAAHDALEQEYYHEYNRSSLNHMRMNLKSAGDPMDPATERQILVGLGVLGALAVWQLNGRKKGRA